MRIFLLLVLSLVPLSAQTLVRITGTNFVDASLHKLSGSCNPIPAQVTDGSVFVAPIPLPFSVVNGYYVTNLLPGTYTVSCALKYGLQSVNISMSWIVPAGGPYQIKQVVTTTPGGQTFTVLPQQLAPGGNLNDVLTKDASATGGQKWAPQTGGGGGGIVWP